MARVLVLLSAVCFGTTGTAQALGPDAAPLTVGAVRVAVGGALLLLVARAAPAVAAAWPRRELGVMAVAIAAYQLAFFAAVDRTGVAVGTVVALGSAPAIAGVAGRLVDREPLTGRWAAATALACAGVMLLVLGGGDASVDPLGIVLAMVAGSGYATYAVLAKRLLRRGHAPERVMAASFSLGAVLLVPVLVLGDVSWVATGDGLALALFLGAIPTALAYVLFARGLRHLTPGETATLTLAEPLTATGLGILALGERPGAVAALGAGLVLAGLLALALPARRSAPQPAVAAA
ncbi:MAG TPA: EamA family transporter [Solirubrobacteraceae bacterium]|nr:EamA family transporter [Solirubrobacteraceae bacterium]